MQGNLDQKIFLLGESIKVVDKMQCIQNSMNKTIQLSVEHHCLYLYFYLYNYSVKT